MELGTLYYAIGRKSYEAAAFSARSLRRNTPNLPIFIHTNTDLVDNCFDKHIKVGKPKQFRSGRIDCLINTEFERTLFLDADTYICDDISELFDLLDYFDMAATLAPHYINRRVVGVPECFPELNLGVLVWNNNVKMKKLFEEWKEEYTRGASQPSFRKVLYESDVRFAVVPWEYNCRYGGPGYLFAKAKILHKWDKPKKLEDVAATINENQYKRVFTGKKLFVTDGKKDIILEREY
jgi:hypothetical protein